MKAFRVADDRVERAQKLYWEVEALRRLEAGRKSIAPKLLEMAGLHEELGRELLVNRSAEGWTDLFAAVTAWAEAGRSERATNLLDWSRTQVPNFAGRENLNAEIDHMASWVEQESGDPRGREMALACAEENGR